MDDRGVGWAVIPKTLRLYVIAAERWPEIDGHYAAVDLITFPCHRFLNLVYAWCIERIPSDKREEWEMQLTAALPGREKARPTPSVAEQEGADFMAAMAMHQSRTAS